MGPLASRRAVSILISLMIVVGGICPASALSFPGLSRGNPTSSLRGTGSGTAIAPTSPSGKLQEVTAPGAVQQLTNHLAGHRPRLTLKSPGDGAILNGNDWTLQLEVEDWPLASDPQLGIGPHVAVQIDDQPPLRFSEGVEGPGNGSTVTATLPALSPGSHRLSAYAAYPWGEAAKGPGASLHWRLHQYQALKGTQPENDAPWLVMVSPSELGANEPLLLDWLVWNAPLQNLRDGDGRWRLRLTVNGDSFLVDRQEAIWLRQSNNSSNPATVQMELLDGLGDPITPSFNNQLRPTPPRAKSRAVWLQSKLSESELARLLGETQPEVTSETSPLPGTQPEGSTALEQTSTRKQTSESQLPSSASPQETAEVAKPLEVQIPSENETSTTAPPPSEASRPMSATPETTAPPLPSITEKPKPAKPAPKPTSSETRLAPTSSLGGSARELLKPDGTQR